MNSTAASLFTTTPDYADNECSSGTYNTQQVVLSGFLTPILTAFGMVTNCLNIIALSSKRMRTSSINWYLLLLSISDLIALFCALFIVALPILSEWCEVKSFMEAVNIINKVTYPAGMVSHTASVYLTISVSVHRFMGVCYPFQARRLCTPAYVRAVLIAVLLFSLFFNITRFMELQTFSCYSLTFNETLVSFAATKLRMNPTYIHIYLGYSYTVVMLIVPFLLLIVMNTKVVIEVHQSRKRHQVLTNDVGSAERAKAESLKERSTTVMLIGVAMAFLACNTLALVSNIIEISKAYVPEENENVSTSSDSQPEMTAESHEDDDVVYGLVVGLSNLMLTLNMSINIFIYYAFSDKFRRSLKHFFCRWEKRYKAANGKDHRLSLTTNTQNCEY